MPPTNPYRRNPQDPNAGALPLPQDGPADQAQNDSASASPFALGPYNPSEIPQNPSLQQDPSLSQGPGYMDRLRSRYRSQGGDPLNPVNNLHGVARLGAAAIGAAFDR